VEKRWVVALALLALALLPALTLAVHSQGEIVVTVTNTTVYVYFRNVQVVVFNRTYVRMGWLNYTALRIAYSCIFSSSYSSECMPVEVLINGSPVAIFEPNSSICNDRLGTCMSYVDTYVGFSTVNVTILEYPSGNLLDSVIIARPTSFVSPSISADIALLVPIALLIAFAGRLTLKGVGLGTIMYGIVVASLGALGIVPSSAYTISIICIVVGAVILYFSR